MLREVVGSGIPRRGLARGHGFLATAATCGRWGSVTVELRFFVVPIGAWKLQWLMEVLGLAAWVGAACAGNLGSWGSPESSFGSSAFELAQPVWTIECFV
jgi:hypothetical protein